MNPLGGEAKSFPVRLYRMCEGAREGPLGGVARGSRCSCQNLVPATGFVLVLVLLLTALNRDAGFRMRQMARSWLEVSSVMRLAGRAEE